MSDAIARSGSYPGRGLHGAVVERLGQRIVAGTPAPGEALPQEPVLAGEYDVSRTVVREALRVLAAKGLVDARPMRGTRVRPRREWRLLDPDLLRWALDSEGCDPLLGHLFEIRLMVEPSAARMAAERADATQHRRLEQSLEALVRASEDVAAFIEADLVLHRVVLEMTANPLIGELITPIEAALRLGRRVQVEGADGGTRTPAASIEAHRVAVEAIVAADAEAAEMAMRGVVRAAADDARRAMQRRLPARA